MNKVWLSVTLLLSLSLTGCDESEPAAARAAPPPAEESAMNKSKVAATEAATEAATAEAAAAGLPQGDHSARVAQLYQEIRQLVGTAAATEPAQCRKVALGHKPCGGPAAYLIYSVKDLDEAALLAKVQQYNLLDQAEQQRLGLVSDCAVVPEPGLALVDGVCVASGHGDTF